MRELRDDGRLSVTQLAERLNMSRGATCQRLSRLQSAGPPPSSAVVACLSGMFGGVTVDR